MSKSVRKILKEATSAVVASHIPTPRRNRSNQQNPYATPGMPNTPGVPNNQQGRGQNQSRGGGPQMPSGGNQQSGNKNRNNTQQQNPYNTQGYPGMPQAPGYSQPRQRSLLMLLAPFAVELVKEISPNVRKALFRFRQQLAPTILLGIAAIGGAAVSHEGFKRGFVVSLVAGLLAAWWLRGPLLERPRVRRDFAVCVGAATLWCWATALFGFGNTGTVGVVIWAVLAIAWWRRHGVRRTEDFDSSAVPAPRSSPQSPAEGLSTLRTALERPVVSSAAPGSSEPTEVVEGGDAGSSERPAAPEAPVEPVLAPIPPEQLAAAATEIGKAWTELQDKRPNLKYVKMVDAVPFDDGVTGTLLMDRGRLHIGTVQGELPYISSGLEFPLQALLLEQHPDYTLLNSKLLNPNYLRLQVMARSPIEETVYFRRPDVANGRIRYGLYADGRDSSSMRLYTTDSMYGGFILGSQGSGKSRLIELIVLSALSLRNTVILYIDGQDGASSPILYNNLWSGGPAEADEFLAGIGRLMEYRNRYNRAHRNEGFTPSPGFPGLLVIIEECHGIYNEQNAAKHGKVAREGRKLGVAELANSQYAGLQNTFGNLAPLRDCLLASNTIVLRTTSKSSNQMIPNLGLNPGELPLLPGYGVVAAPPDDPHSRSAPFRALYIPKQRDRDDPERTVDMTVPTLEEWFARAQDEKWQPELDAGSARAFGPLYTDRHAIAARREAALLAELDGRPALPSSTTLALPASSGSFGREPSGEQGTMADAIMALPWDRYSGEMRRTQMFELLPSGANPSTVASALRALCAGLSAPLEAVGDGVYRKKGS